MEVEMTDYTLTYGKHDTRDEGMCLMEAVAYLAGEPHTDEPACACPILTAYAVRVNDAMGKGSYGDALRARYLHDLAPMLVGSKSTPEVEQARLYVLADHAVRVFAPLALESIGLNDEAARLRTIGAVVDKQSVAKAAQHTSRAADEAAEDARSAWCAYWAVAEAADAGEVWKDAWYAAGDAAGAAARAADASGDAVWNAARQALIAALEVAP